MCGIVAIVGEIDFNVRKMFTNLLVVDTLRGPDSTGVIGVGDMVSTYKKAVDGFSFATLRGYENVLKMADSAMIGHNRWATVGVVCDETAHPFSRDHIHLVHNGTLKEWRGLSSDALTDSEAICHAIAKEGAKAALEQLNGAYALVWYDEKEDKVLFARNWERPLYIAKLKGRNTYSLASEKEMIELAAARNSLVIDNVAEVDTGKIFSIDLSTNKLEQVDTFEIYTPPVVSHYSKWYSQDLFKKLGISKRKIYYALADEFVPFANNQQGYGKIIGAVFDKKDGRELGEFIAYGRKKEDFEKLRKSMLRVKPICTMKDMGKEYVQVSIEGKLSQKQEEAFWNKVFDSESSNPVAYLEADLEEEKKEAKCCVCDMPTSNDTVTRYGTLCEDCEDHYQDLADFYRLSLDEVIGLE